MPEMTIYLAFRSYDMARPSIFPSFAKVKLFSLLVCFVLAAFVCVSLCAAAFAKSDRWMGCRGADIDARITGCTEVIGRGSRETTRDQITAYINRGGAYRAKGDFDRALADLDKALRLDPKSALALLERASNYHAKGEFDRAIADYDGAIAAQPKSAAAFSGRGETYRAKNDLDRAIADYDKALQLDDNLVTAYGGRARAYRGKGERAKEDLEAALRLDPQLAPAKDALDEVNRLIAKSAAPLTVAAPTVPAAPAANPILLVLLMLIALIGLFAIVAMHFFAKPVDKSLAVADDAPKRYRENLQGEVDGAALYRTLADVEADEKLAEVYRRLAAVEDAHAEYWRGELRRRDARIPRLKPSFRSRALGWLARRFGPAFVLPTINTLEQADSGAYDHQPEAVKGGLPADERSHARILEVIASPTQGLEGGTIARLEGRHRAMAGMRCAPPYWARTTGSSPT
jgi:tetratricopeptide (TPR) repeat protein